jgi:tellurite resistance protein TerC
MTADIWLWVGFNCFLILAIFVDLNLQKGKEVKPLQASLTSLCWILLASLFNFFIYYTQGSDKALQFSAGYLIELSLSIDNLFVFLLIFSTFQVNVKNQHTILFWGILGALILRLIFIIAGTLFIQKFHWLTYLFGAFLVVMGVTMFKKRAKSIELEKSFVYRFLKKWIPIQEDYVGDQFFIRKEGTGKLFATPLFLVLLLVEACDLLFAIDSIPAIFGVTLDPFIVYTSNAFAILGLRSFYFTLQPLMKLFSYLHYGVALILVVVGLKMLLQIFLTVPTTILLAVIIAIFVSSLVLSLCKSSKTGNL